MPARQSILWVGWGFLFLRPLLPVIAILVNRATGRFQQPPWLNRLALSVALDLLVNWALLGMIVCGRHTAWLHNLALIPQVGLILWVISALGPRPLPGFVIPSALVLAVGSVVWSAITLGWQTKWLDAMTVSSLMLFALTLWRLLGFFLQQDEEEYTRSRPTFWLLSTWTLDFGTLLIFLPLANHFLKHLPSPWVLLPWLANYSVGLLLAITLSWTFLCRRPASS